LVTSLVMETTSLSEDLPPLNNDDIVALNENLNRTVVMNRLRTCHEYAVLKKIFTSSWRWWCHIRFAGD
jgi:hypothetical protein